MEQRITKLFYQNREIIYFNFQGLIEDDEVIEMMHHARDYVLKLNRPTLQLTNITGVYFTPAIMKHMGLFKEAEHLVIKDAVVGVTGVKRILFQLYQTLLKGKTQIFNSEEEAKAWLAAGTAAHSAGPSHISIGPASPV